MTSGEFASFPVDQIWVDREKRQRRELTGIETLAASIAAVGLINPIVIERTGELRAGERRWTAVQMLHWSHVSVQFVDELSEAELQLLELEENVKREALTWEDECAAVYNYHMLRQKQDPQWDQTQTAAALNMPKAAISSRMIVHREILAGNKRVIEAPKLSVAVGVAVRARERAASSAISAAVNSVPITAAPPKPAIPLINADFREWAASYSGEPFNMIHCDFPYGVNADKHDQGQAAALGGYSDSFDIYTSLLDTLAQSMDNVISPSAHIIFWFSMDYYQFTKERLEQMGWAINPFPLVWHKIDNTGILPDPKRGPRRVYETALFGSRGDRLIVGAKANATAHPGKDKSIHMSEKPVPVLRHFMEMVVDKYSRVLDPTCGSGNSIKAATKLKAADALGIEVNEEFYNRACEAYFNDEQ